MIDGKITHAEREHLDRVWFEIVGGTVRSFSEKRRGRRRPAAKTYAPPVDRRWYFDAAPVPPRTQVRAAPRDLPGNQISATRISRPLGSARFHKASHNRKLSPIEMMAAPGSSRGRRPVPRAPFVSSTYASIEATCPDSCTFKRSGCFADSGFTKMAGQLMDRAATGHAGLEVIREEARLIRRSWKGGRVPQDGARGGRDLRLHVGGDVDSEDGARELGAAARNWRFRGGGAVWSFTHRWRSIPRAAWGPGLQVFASIENPADIERAAKQGYPSALVVRSFASPRAELLPNGWRLIPCPAETRGATCASCRLCLDRDVLAMKAVIGFAVHGVDAAKVRDRLVQIGRRS